MDSILRQIEIDDENVIFTEAKYRPGEIENYRIYFEDLRRQGKLKGAFYDDFWIGNSGIKRYSINFRFDAIAYKSHTYKILGIPADGITDTIRCYALFIYGEYVLRTLQMKIAAIIDFLMTYQDNMEKVSEEWKKAVEDFLWFIGLPAYQCKDILDGIREAGREKPGPRRLAPLINYLAVANETADMYAGDLSDEEYIRWFPIYFWAHITFVLPLRPTEMLLAPFGCIERKNGKVFLLIRRTQLKKQARTVHYEVGKDYKIFRYAVPETSVIRNIEKYQALTRDHKRRFLFEYGPRFANHVFSLSAFNDLLAEFVTLFLQGNRKYDFARYASGIADFQNIVAGDSRPIAISNLYYMDVGAEICRQLADHEMVSTTYHYYQNVSETIEASSIMQIQRKINLGYIKQYDYTDYYKRDGAVLSLGCASPRRPGITGDIEDCIAEGHIEECFGCKYYAPDRVQLEKALSKRKAELDSASRAVFAYMAERKKDRIEDFEKLFLDAYTASTRYRTACDKKAEEDFGRWQRHRHTVTTSC